MGVQENWVFWSFIAAKKELDGVQPIWWRSRLDCQKCWGKVHKFTWHTASSTSKHIASNFWYTFPTQVIPLKSIMNMYWFCWQKNQLTSYLLANVPIDLLSAAKFKCNFIRVTRTEMDKSQFTQLWYPQFLAQHIQIKYEKAQKRKPKF